MVLFLFRIQERMSYQEPDIIVPKYKKSKLVGVLMSISVKCNLLQLLVITCNFEKKIKLVLKRMNN